jgi:NAD(P)H dehydrogenase (quinone)
MTEILILDGHPDADSLTTALATAYAAGAVREGGRVRTIALRDLDFDLVLRHGYHRAQSLEPDLEATLAAIRAARHVVFAFPTWWAAPPALVKGFVDRLFLPGIAFRFEPGKAMATGLFAGRSARLITTMDSPSWWYWWKHGRSVHHAFLAATLELVGFGPIDARTVFSVRTLKAAAIAKALATAGADGARDARRSSRKVLEPRVV